MEKRGNRAGVALYLLLLAILIGLLAVSAFRLYPLNDGFFTRYLVALVFVLMLLPLVPKIKIFDIVDIKREARMFKAKKK